MTETVALLKSSRLGHAVAGPPTRASSSLPSTTKVALRPSKTSLAQVQVQVQVQGHIQRCPSGASEPQPAAATSSHRHNASASSSRIPSIARLNNANRDSSSAPSRPVSSLSAYAAHTSAAHAARARQGHRPSPSTVVSPNPPRVRTQSSQEPKPVDHQPVPSKPEPASPVQAPASPLKPTVPSPSRPRALSDQGPRPIDLESPPPHPSNHGATSPAPLDGVAVEDFVQLAAQDIAEQRKAAQQRLNRASSSVDFARNRSESLHPERPVLEPLYNAQRTTSDWNGRDLLPLKTSSLSSTPNDTRRFSTYRHHISIKSLGNNEISPLASAAVRVPPIRRFRSSSSRKSLTLDMSYDQQYYANLDGSRFSQQEPPMRRFDPRQDQDGRHMTPPVSSRQVPQNNEDSGDVFLNIAREEAYRQAESERPYGGTYTPVSGVSRLGHRRPLSTNVATYYPTSPPKQRRRMSDQQERPNLRDFDQDQASQNAVIASYRSLARERPASAHPSEDASRIRAGVSLRPSPLTPRSPVYQENTDPLKYTRRRSSVAESTPPLSGRQYKSNALAYGHNKTYSSSPLVRSFDLRSQTGQEHLQGMDGTESTTSTTAPSTLWDEIDEMRTRIHRLELTGKMPATSDAAVAGMTGERPVTANTAMTAASLSPKRPGALPADAQSVISPQRDSHPLLLTALGKSRHLLSPEVFQALECVSQDALQLSSMMGLPGHPGPISSSASAIGSTTGVTDRQLRRKADSVCRGLTELCLALNEEAGQDRTATVSNNLEQHRGTPTTPTIPKSNSGLPMSRRSSVVQDQALPQSQSTSRIMSKYDERRHSAIPSSAPPISLHTNPHHGETNMGRRSSLLISRTRRGKTEEPEEGRESPFLRTRRAQTLEPEDRGKMTSPVRTRTPLEESEDIRYNASSRTDTDRNETPDSERASDQQGAPIDTESVASSAPHRRRLVSDLHSSRVAAPPTNGALPQRKYMGGATPDRDVGTRTPDLGVSRRFSLHNRAGSLNSRRGNRESMIPSAPAPSNANAGEQK